MLILLRIAIATFATEDCWTVFAVGSACSKMLCHKLLNEVAALLSCSN